MKKLLIIVAMALSTFGCKKEMQPEILYYKDGISVTCQWEGDAIRYNIHGSNANITFALESPTEVRIFEEEQNVTEAKFTHHDKPKEFYMLRTAIQLPNGDLVEHNEKYR